MDLYFLAKGDLLLISSFFEREHNVVSRLHENEHCGPLTTSVWWLMLCVNLTELRDAPRDGKTWLLGMFARVCLEEISIWISEMSQEGDPPQCRWASSNSLRAWWKKKVKEGWIRSLLKLTHPSSPALGRRCSLFLGLRVQAESYTTGSLGSQAFGFGLKLHHQISWASSLQTAGCGTARPP